MFNNQILEYSAKSSGVEVRDGSAGGTDEGAVCEPDGMSGPCDQGEAWGGTVWTHVG